MKNRLLRLTFFTLIIFHLNICLAQQPCSNASSACSNFVKQYPSGTFSQVSVTTSNNWPIINSSINAGNWSLYNVIKGNTYEWSTCGDFGGYQAWNAELSLFNNSDNTKLCYSNNSGRSNCPNAPYINWTADFTGVVKLLVSVSTTIRCQSNGPTGPYSTLVWRLAAQGQTCTAVTIGTQPQSQPATVGNTATFSVIASGTAPFNYQWRKNSINISNATSASYTTPILAASDNGSIYSCYITNCNGSNNTLSNTATLSVTNNCTAVTIGTQPQSQPATVGSTATFSVISSGTAPFNYQWRKNSINISNGTSASYTTPILAASDNGSLYSCYITNCNGSNNTLSNTAALNVTNNCTAVTIGTQPQSQTVTVGNSATFSVISSGTAPFNYQWRKNSINISNGTSASYTTPILAASDNGSIYSCYITNCSDTKNIISNNATVNITSIPQYKITGNVKLPNINYTDGKIEYSFNTVTVSLKNATGSSVATTTTDNQGNFTFSGNYTSTYQVIAKYVDCEVTKTDVKANVPVDIKLPYYLLFDLNKLISELEYKKDFELKLFATYTLKNINARGYDESLIKRYYTNSKIIIDNDAKICESLSRLIIAQIALKEFAIDAKNMIEPSVANLYGILEAVIQDILTANKVERCLSNTFNLDFSLSSLDRRKIKRSIYLVRNGLLMIISSLPNDKLRTLYNEHIESLLKELESYIEVNPNSNGDVLNVFLENLLKNSLTTLASKVIYSNIYVDLMTQSEVKSSYDKTSLSTYNDNFTTVFNNVIGSNNSSKVSISNEKTRQIDGYIKTAETASGISAYIKDYIKASEEIPVLCLFSTTADKYLSLSTITKSVNYGSLATAIGLGVNRLYNIDIELSSATSLSFRSTHELNTLDTEVALGNIRDLTLAVNDYNTQLQSVQISINNNQLDGAKKKIADLLKKEDFLDETLRDVIHPIEVAAPFANEQDTSFFNKFSTDAVNPVINSYTYRQSLSYAMSSFFMNPSNLSSRDSLNNIISICIRENNTMINSLSNMSDRVANIAVPAHLKAISISNLGLLNKNTKYPVKLKYKNYGSITAKDVYVKINVDNGFTISTTDSIKIKDLLPNTEDSLIFILNTPNFDTSTLYNINFISANIPLDGMGGAFRIGSQKVQINTQSYPFESGIAAGAKNYERNDQITLLATPNKCFKFINWTENGVEVSINPTYSFIADMSRNLIANFKESPKYKIDATINPLDGGKVLGTNTYCEDETVTLQAKVNPKYKFVNWTESGTLVSSDSILSINAKKVRTMTANFELRKITIVASNTTGGTVTGAKDYFAGDTITLKATSDKCFKFISWTENGTVASTDSNYKFTSLYSRNLVANFEGRQYKLDIKPTVGGGVQGGSGIFCLNELTQLVATPNDGFRFVGWKNCNGTTPFTTTPSIVLKVLKDSCLIAEFAKTSTSLFDIEDLGKIILSPNPNNGIFNISFELKKVVSTDIEIFNSIGQMIYSKTLKNQNSTHVETIDIGNTSKGIYLVKIKLGQKEIVEKIFVN
jgi:Secretion system C-terminal sorting domain/Divergent InlB B-repeat domain